MVLVPDWVARNEHDRQILEAKAESHSHNSDWKRWNELLRDIDPRLSYVFVPMLEDPPPGITPLRWHVVRVNENGPDTYWPLETEDGEYREIGSTDLEDYKGRDLWNSQVRHEIATQQRRRLEAKQRAKDLRSEQRRFELGSALDALNRPSVAFGTKGWTNTPAGKRGKKS